MEGTFRDVAARVVSPISQLLHYFTTAFSDLKLVVRVITRSVLPIRTMSSVATLLYLLAPIFVFLDSTATLYIPAHTTPNNGVLFDTAFPLCIFVNVSCITNANFGLAARAS